MVGPSERTSTRSRRRLDVLAETPHPAYVVWELSLRCDHACRHCGSRAGAARSDELGTQDLLDIVGQLAELGAREVVLIGGEAYLHDGFLDVVRALRDAGIFPSMVTGGMGITQELAAEMADAGMRAVSVSVDGLEATHDMLRVPGSFASATRALHFIKAAGIRSGANTNFNRSNCDQVEGLYEHLRQCGIGGWQVQITVPMGRAADRPGLLLQPWDLLDLLPRIAAIKERAREDGVLVMPGNNLGYFGPEEAVLRSPLAHQRDCFQGCMAGRFVLGIESGGAIKGCLSLQSDSYVGGNVREQSIAEIWRDSRRLRFTRTPEVENLWGFCRECPFADPCMGGCSFTSHALFGRPGNNPYCHFRARHFAKRGQRERLISVSPASGEPMDRAVYECVLEALDAPDPGLDIDPAELVRITQRPARPGDPKTCR